MDASHSHAEHPDSLAAAIARAAHHLPDQGPIHVFIHHNTLHALQHLPFHDALAQAREIHGAEPYLPEARFRAELARGRITAADLREIVANELGALGGREPIAGRAVDELYYLILAHGIERQSASSLAYALGEARRQRVLRADAPGAHRPEFAAAQGAYARAVVDGIGARESFAEAVERLTGEAVVARARARFEQATRNGRRAAGTTPAAFGLAGARAEGLARRAGELANDRARAPAWLAAERAVCGAVLADFFDAAPTVPALERLADARDARLLAASLWGAARAAAPRDLLREPRADLLARVGVDRTYVEALAAFVNHDPRELVHAELIPLCAAFLDDGYAPVAMPERDKGFLEAFRAHVMDGRAVLPEWARGRLRERIAQDVQARRDGLGVVERRLEELGVARENAELYVRRVLLHLPGWAGMFGRLERNPAELRFGRRPVRVVDFLAVKLTLDACALEYIAATEFGHKGPLRGLADALRRRGLPPAHDPRPPLDVAWGVFQLCQLAGVDARALTADERTARALAELLEDFDDMARRRLFQEAYELHYRRELVAALLVNAAEAQPRAARDEPAPTPPPRPKLQLLTCIDDREESFKRHLEEMYPQAETFGVAGFFGVAIAFKGLDDAEYMPLCPVVATPSHAITEVPARGFERVAATRAKRRARWGRVRHRAGQLARSGLGGALLAPTLGLFASLALAVRLLAPRLSRRLMDWAADRFFPRPATELTPPRALDAPRNAANLWEGFTVDEKADRVMATLQNVGLVRNFAPVVAILGHGSQSINNPHFSAYDCGACGGRHGWANGRLFARMANHAAVRATLRERGIDIPDDTVFIGGMHNTANDGIMLAPVEGREADAAALARVAEARAWLEAAAMASAHERCRRFASAPRFMSRRRALRHARSRAADLAQPRPELGHVTNASCIVGRRALSRGVFLDRRAFLVSYDAAIDPEHKILERILAAVGPVGAGISLEYYFSTVDNDRYGCGTKLPHNPTANLGVMEGASSDLRTGLPKQMIEIHEPIRLLCVVEATTDALLQVVARQPGVAELVTRGWMLVVAVHPETRAAHFFDPSRGAFVPYDPTAGPAAPVVVPRANNSTEWYAGQIDHLPVALIPAPVA